MTDHPTVLLAHPIFGDGTEPLAAAIRERLPDDVDLRVGHDEAETHRHAPDADILVTHRLDPELRETAPVRWVQTLSAGVDSYDLDAFRESGVVLTNASGIHARPIADHVLGALLHFERRFDRAVAQQRDREWARYGAGELADRTVCVVGVGAIGSRVSELCLALGTDVVGVKRDPSSAPDGVDCVTPDELGEALARSDRVVLACPLTDETRGLIGREELDALGEDGVLVNIARGEVVDEGALTEALRDDRLRGAALDVFEEEPLPEDSLLWGMENVLATPHVAGTTPHYWERAADIFAENYRRYRAGEDLRNRVV
ncbi:D-2-hydroxyacid dehydrogenase [Halomarina litorea]|uniref:D-2-hydroxyacid dehydrogenase n=1 Tax=Halomarina litorea TaxID=2961595 RepID=UPI0020C44E61|nr:D-2-hydroxyacid dehydrogenase [Halomarina sp. BCD28]